MSSSLPIAVFDSGVGGVSVLKQLINIMPNESYIYYGDSKNAPYGSKSHEDIRTLVLFCVKELVDMGIKALVVACNTATSVAIDEIRAIYPELCVIGVEPAIKPAAEHTKNGNVLVMATPATLSEERFLSLVDKYCSDCEVELLPCVDLAKLIEQGHIDDETINSHLEKILSPYKNKVDSVVLGCTHYPFVKGVISKHLGESVKIFDGAIGTANETRRRLEQCDLLCEDNAYPDIKILTSGDNESFCSLVSALFNV